MTVGNSSRHRASTRVSIFSFALAVFLLAVSIIGGCSKLRDTAVNPAPSYAPQPAQTTPPQQELGPNGRPLPAQQTHYRSNTDTRPNYGSHESLLIPQPTAGPDRTQLSYSRDQLPLLPQNQWDNMPQDSSPSWQPASAANRTARYRDSVQLRDEPGRAASIAARDRQQTQLSMPSQQATPPASLPPYITKVAIADAEQFAWSAPPRPAPRPQVLFAPPPNQNATAVAHGLTEPAVKYTTLPVITDLPPTQPAVAQNLTQTQTPTISDLIRRTKTLLADEPANMPAQMALRCLLLADGQKNEAMDTTFLDQLPPEQQPRAHALMQAMLLTTRSQYGHDRNDPDLANRALDAVDDLWSHVAQQAELTIATLKICSKVQGFARYDLIPPSELTTGREQTVLIYCEVQNLRTEQDDNGKFLSRLRAEFTLYDSQGSVRAQNKQDVLDSPSAKPRRDFFLTGKLLLPYLEPGKYHIKAQITDKIAGKISLPQQHTFEVRPTVHGSIY